MVAGLHSWWFENHSFCASQRVVFNQNTVSWEQNILQRIDEDQTMPRALRIRQATAADAADLARLNRLFDQGEIPVGLIAEQLVRCQGVETAYLAEYEEAIVGFACLRLAPTLFSAEPYAELTELFVEKEYRRLGIGAALMEHVEAVARQAGASELFLMTGFKNTNAHHFYHASGYSLRCLVMWRELMGNE